MNLLQQLTANHGPGPFHEPAGDEDLSAGRLPVRLIAFYLPQFHPIAENDGWWGAGFTEWTNVTKALPRFHGHYQPRLPADLGFYDLRLPEILARQARLARRHGVYGFCFYHYWFSGRRVLERPVQTLLDHPAIDLPFCLSWANENWTRRWDGADTHILLEQNYSVEGDAALVDSMLPALRDPRYIRIDGRPLIMVYRPNLLPDAPTTLARWRERLVAAGVGDPVLVMNQHAGHPDPRPFGLDAALQFPPSNFMSLSSLSRKPVFLFDAAFRGMLFDYEEIAFRFRNAAAADYPVFPGVMPDWDNEARRPGGGTVFRGSTPALYSQWLDAACRRAMREHAGEYRLVFVNAWNEWAEGAYLEPDRHYGHAYLRATARVLGALPTAHDADLGAPEPSAATPPVKDNSVRARAGRVVRQQRANAHNAVQRWIHRRSAGARKGPSDTH